MLRVRAPLGAPRVRAPEVPGAGGDTHQAHAGGDDPARSDAARGGGSTPTAEGIVVVDKPAGWTSHDVVARMRKITGTRRVGHAGTLDPMATGVLVVGIGLATRLLGHIAGHGKAYTATIRLGWGTTTDDSEGERLVGEPADGLGFDELLPAVELLTGTIMQRPSAVSAIKVDGRRAHERVRAGERVELPERPVVVSVFDIAERRAVPDLGALDLDVEVECSSGTYIRALARDLGAALGVGGHLTALRRVRVGGFTIDEARTLEELAAERADHGSIRVVGLAEAARSAFPVVAVTDADARAVRHGRPIELARAWAPFRGIAGAQAGWSAHVEPHALFDFAGEFLALVVPDDDSSTRYLAVFSQP